MPTTDRPTGTSYVLMRVAPNGFIDPVPAQSFGRITRGLAEEKSRKYAEAAKPGERFVLDRIEHIDRVHPGVGVFNAPPAAS